MTVVFVIDHFNSKSDGTCITAQRYEEELIRQGHTVRVVAFGVSGENKYALKRRFIPIITALAKKQNIYLAKYDKKVLRQAFEGADIIHLFLPLQVQRKALKIAKKMGIAVTAAFHLHPDNVTKNSGIKRLPSFVTRFMFWYWRKTFYDKVKHIHCPSQFAADELKKHKYKAQMHVISNGITPNFCPDGNKQDYSNSRNFEILMVGRFAGEKRQDILIEAVKLSKYKDIINLTFAGRGPQLKKLESMAQSLPNKPVFQFFTQEQLLAKIRSSDLYIHAADTEIEGMSCMEAFASGLTPLICNAEKSATKQFIIDDRCCFTAGSAESLCKKIDYWIEHPDELKNMGEAYVKFAQRFSLENSVKSAVEMFEDAIADAKQTKQVAR